MRQTRNLRRSRQNAMIGGVCGGIAEHFGWSVTGTRVVYVLLSVLSVAFPGILVYIILWIVVPEARTTAQKLEMRGDPVNVNNIGKFVKDEFESVKKSFRGKNRK